MIIVDTLNRNFGGLDENSTRDMSAFVSNVDAVFRISGKTVVIVHHSGHAGERGRGSTVLPGACEAEFFIKKQSGGLALNCSKQKNAPEHESIYFKTKAIELPGRFDDEGEPISSLVLEMLDSADGQGIVKKPNLSGNQKIVFDALVVIFNQAGLDVGSASISFDDAVEKIRILIPCEPKRQTERVKATIGSLENKGLITIHEGRLFPT